MMSITGQNAAYALGLSIGIALALSLVYVLMFLVLGALNHRQPDVGAVLDAIWSLFKVTLLCVAPIVFLISFALLQRFKIKY